MATYTKPFAGQPSYQRIVVISDVAVGDQLDIFDILGRPARYCRIDTTDATDSVSYLVNHKRVLKQQSQPSIGTTTGARKETPVLFWNGAAQVFTKTGLEINLETGLEIDSLEFTSVTLNTGTTVTVTVW